MLEIAQPDEPVLQRPFQLADGESKDVAVDVPTHAVATQDWNGSGKRVSGIALFAGGAVMIGVGGRLRRLRAGRTRGVRAARYFRYSVTLLEVRQTDFEVHLGRVALEAVADVEAEQRQHDRADVHAEARADVVAEPVLALDLIG